MHARQSQQAAEVSRVEAEEAEITSRNTQLNKQAAALQNEVGVRHDALLSARMHERSGGQAGGGLQGCKLLRGC